MRGMTAFSRPPANSVSPRAKRYWTTRAALGWIVILIVAASALVGGAGSPPGTAWALWGLVAVGLAHTIVMPRWRFRVHRWETSATAVYTQQGWFDQERRIAPMSRIQTVDSDRGPFEQLFGLTNVTITTASAAGPLHIKGLSDQMADRLVDELTRAAALNTDDAT